MTIHSIVRENPAHPTQTVGEIRKDDAAAVFATVARATVAQAAWAQRSLEERAAMVIAAVDSAAMDAPDLARLLSREMGKLLTDCLGEIRFARALAHDQCARALRLLPDETRGLGPGRRVLRHRPYGVIAAIVPWNAPIILAMTKIAPALVSGNAVVVKPSPLSPLALTAFLTAVARRLPDPVLQVVNGGGATGEALINARGIAKVAFTGGTTVGGRVLQAASARFLPCVMELGGNDPLIVLDDFDFAPATIEAIVWASFLNAGQVCMAAKRLLVPEHLAGRFTDAYVSTARTLLRMGDPLEAASTMGPMINMAARDQIQALADDSVWQGGKVIDLCISPRPQEGYFLPPRLVTGLPEDAGLIVEEQFGPIVPITTYRDQADMLRLANTGTLGLSASIWTPDIERGWDLLGEIRAGFGMINAHNRSGFSFDLPFGGIGASGFGREYGDEGVREYSLPQSLHAPAARAGGGAAYPIAKD